MKENINESTDQNVILHRQQLFQIYIHQRSKLCH